MLSLRLISPMEKVFLDGPLPTEAYTAASCLGGEEAAFQAVLCRDGDGMAPVSLAVESPLGECVRLFQVGQVPCALPAYPHARDAHYLATRPGLFPDPLLPVEEGAVEVSAFFPTVVWVSVRVPRGFPAGEWPLTLRAACRGEEAAARFTLGVVGADLPPQRLVYTQWVHGDCLADHYGVPVYSEGHWRLWEKFLAAAAEGGQNMVLTPIVTPPLDTEPGAQRPCVQLLGVEKEGETYRFDFSRLERFIAMARRCGIERFEMAHLFTQWGAKAAPAIYGREGGIERRLFGWDTPAASGAYGAFLRQLLPALTAFLRGQGLSGKAVFHVSDEPSTEHLESYRRAKELVKPYLGEFPLYDALSDPAFYDQGLVDHPVPATDHIGPFLERRVPGLWAYTCCGQSVDVGNRFLAMPSCRNRVLGWQLYKYRLAGFLHWGYNFWYSQNSREKLDPWRVTDGGGAFPGGDPFSVYPGGEGPILSLRMKIFSQGLQDLRALELAERLTGCDPGPRVLPGYGSMTFARYPLGTGELPAARERLNRLIAQEGR